MAEFYGDKKKHIITCVTEHKSVCITGGNHVAICRKKKKGFKVTYLPVNTDGLIDLNLLKKSITKETLLVSIMGVHNEIGVNTTT